MHNRVPHCSDKFVLQSETSGRALAGRLLSCSGLNDESGVLQCTIEYRTAVTSLCCSARQVVALWPGGITSPKHAEPFDLR
jgi:hypothetical protein